MNKEQLNIQIIDGIYDVQPLPIPPLSLMEVTITILLVVSILSLLSYLIWHIFFSKKAKALREIQQLHNNYLKDSINYHNAIYQLCYITKNALGYNHLSKNTPLPEKFKPNIAQWESFIGELSTLRYEKSYDKKIMHEDVFNDAQFWVKKLL